MEMGTLIIDIDGTICTQEKDYAEAKPIWEMIDKVNHKYDEGYTICFYTARGSGTGKDWTAVTLQQLAMWKVKYHSLKFGKPPATLYVDDRAINALNWEVQVKNKAVVDKIWGKEYLLACTDKYAMKRLEIYKDNCISNQYHNIKEETWHIVEGKGIAFIEWQPIEVTPGMTIHITPGTLHQVKALTDKLVIIEASTTELGDVVRLNREFAYVCNS